MRLIPTKMDMARVIIQALFNAKELPEPNNPNVMRLFYRNTKESLRGHYEMASKILSERGQK